ncbi:MAG: hypothetical protein WA908_10475 [Pontixanthobacter sp.]
MSAPRIENAAKRIEAALARIALVANADIGEPGPDTTAANVEQAKHNTLKQMVDETLVELDALISEIDVSGDVR